jgi:hypothetical protein
MSIGTVDAVLLASYILCFVFFNLLAYLISSFYQKKFGENSPRSGFLAAIVLALAYTGSLFASTEVYAGMAAARIFLLFGTALASAWSAISLYFTMKRVRK